MDFSNDGCLLLPRVEVVQSNALTQAMNACLLCGSATNKEENRTITKMMQFPTTIVEQCFSTYAITDFDVSKEEDRLIFSTNLNCKMNMWAMDLPGTYPYFFAHLEESCSFIKM